jgi:cytidylate kinase
MQSISENNLFIVAIDGPAGAGKSTIAKGLAKKLGVSYLDTGAMYRSLTLKAMRNNLSMEDEIALVDMAAKTKLDLIESAEGLRIILDGADVSSDIRSVEVTNNTFYIARIGALREIMVNWQREMGGRRSLVAEGRDIGTVVFPEAKYKFYLDAAVEERARRRYKELMEKGKEVAFENILADVKERDHKDITRKVGPLKKADDAIVIDSTPLSAEQVIDTILKVINK